jgi:hypothetical protein
LTFGSYQKLRGLVDVGDAQLHVRAVHGHELDVARGLSELHDGAGQVVDRERAARVADVEGVAHGLGALSAATMPSTMSSM